MPMTVNLTHSYQLIIALMATAVTGQLVAGESGMSEGKVASQRDGWLTDLEAAKKVAQKEGKDILIEFTRSEGCGWCIKLEKEVLAQKAFQQQIPEHYVMVMLNYPHDENQWSTEEKEQYDQLLKYYRIRKFPYLVFADSDGRPYDKESYRDRQPKEYLEEIVGIRSKRERRDSAFASAEKAEGKEKARLLERGLSEVSRRYHRYYPDVIDAIAKADPEDTSGFVAKIRVDEVKSNLERQLRPHYRERNFAAIPATVDEYIREHGPKGEALQVALLYKIQALYTAKEYQAAKALADEVIAMNDASRAAHYASSIKKRIERMSEEKDD